MSTVTKGKPYPTYKDSGVEWLGKIPEYWKISRVSEHAALINGYPFDSELFHRTDGIPLIRIRDLALQETEVFYSGPIIHEALVRRGDILIGMDGDFNVSRWRGNEALLNQRLCCLRPRPTIEPRFLTYLIQYPLEVINDLTYSTTVKHLSSLDINKIRLGYPPPSEQSNIATFLDCETAKIDALVEKKERLIELLQEKRTALITRAVTKGLDPTVPMKDSGIEWLGDVPADRTRTQLKRVVSVCGRIGFRGYTTDDLVEEGEGALALGGANLTDYGRLDLSKRTYLSWAKYEESPEIKATLNDLVIGQRGTCGKVAVIDRDIGPATINPSLVLLRCPQVDSRFLCYWLMGRLLQNVFDSYLSTTAVPMLSQEQIGSVPVFVPSISEQRAIADFLGHETAKIDALIAKVREGIEKLKEYRTALISAAVTGKIDVREVVQA